MQQLCAALPKGPRATLSLALRSLFLHSLLRSLWASGCRGEFPGGVSNGTASSISIAIDRRALSSLSASLMTRNEREAQLDEEIASLKISVDGMANKTSGLLLALNFKHMQVIQENSAPSLSFHNPRHFQVIFIFRSRSEEGGIFPWPKKDPFVVRLSSIDRLFTPPRLRLTGRKQARGAIDAAHAFTIKVAEEECGRPKRRGNNNGGDSNMACAKRGEARL